MTVHPLRLGVVGCGWAGRQAVLAATAGPRTSVMALADIDTARRTSLAEEFAVPHTYGDYHALLQDSTVDAVYLATPPPGRLPLVVASLEAGKHVLVQKPHAIHATEILEMDRAAQRTGRTLQFCYFMRHMPKNRQIRQAIRGGQIGEPYHARVFVKFNSIPPLNAANRWLHIYGQKGGALGQHASHELDLAWWWMGCPQPEWAFAFKHSVYPVDTAPEETAEDYFSGLVGCAGNRTIQVDCSRLLHTDSKTLVELYGSTGAIANRKISHYLGSEFVVEEVGGPDAIAHTHSPDDSIHFYYEIEHFAMAVAGEVKPDVSASDAYKFMQILDALYESARRREKVFIS